MALRTLLIILLCNDMTSFKDQMSTAILENLSAALDTMPYRLGKAHVDLDILHPSPNAQSVSERKHLSTPSSLIAVM